MHSHVDNFFCIRTVVRKSFVHMFFGNMKVQIDAFNAQALYLKKIPKNDILACVRSNIRWVLIVGKYCQTYRNNM